MTADIAVRRSRRAVLAGTAGAVAALAVRAIAVPESASAHDPDDVQLGGPNSTDAPTSITNTSVNQLVLSGYSLGSGTGVGGSSNTGEGVRGQSQSGIGVGGESHTGLGISGFSAHYRGIGGYGVESDGVYGTTNASYSAGVYGENTHQGWGVAGRSNAPAATSDTGRRAALYGENTADGIGVWAIATDGVALYVETLNADAVAIQAMGVTQFQRSGTLTIGAGKSSVTKTGIRVDPGTLVLATLQQYHSGV